MLGKLPKTKEEMESDPSQFCDAEAEHHYPVQDRQQALHYPVQERGNGSNESTPPSSDAENYMPPLPPRHDAYEVGSIQQRLENVRDPHGSGSFPIPNPAVVLMPTPSKVVQTDVTSSVTPGLVRSVGADRPARGFRGRTRGRGRGIRSARPTAPEQHPPGFSRLMLNTALSQCQTATQLGRLKPINWSTCIPPYTVPREENWEDELMADSDMWFVADISRSLSARSRTNLRSPPTQPGQARQSRIVFASPEMPRREHDVSVSQLCEISQLSSPIGLEVVGREVTGDDIEASLNPDEAATCHAGPGTVVKEASMPLGPLSPVRQDDLLALSQNLSGLDIDDGEELEEVNSMPCDQQDTLEVCQQAGTSQKERVLPDTALMEDVEEGDNSSDEVDESDDERYCSDDFEDVNTSVLDDDRVELSMDELCFGVSADIRETNMRRVYDHSFQPMIATDDPERFRQSILMESLDVRVNHIQVELPLLITNDLALIKVSNKKLVRYIRELGYMDYQTKLLKSDCAFDGESATVPLEMVDCCVYRSEFGPQIEINVDCKEQLLFVMQYRIEKLTQRHGSQEAIKIANSELKGKVVQTSHTEMIYKIESIYDLSECDPSHTFNGKNGEISYQTYFKKRYNLQINSNCYMIRMHDASIIPAELCRVLDGSMCDDDDVARISKDILQPSEKMSKVLSIANNLRGNENRWGRCDIVAGRDLICVKAKVLPTPILTMKNGVHLADGNWENDFRGGFVAVPPLQAWAVVVCDYDQARTKPLIRALEQGFQTHITSIGAPIVEVVRTDGGRDTTLSYATCLRELLGRDDPPDFVLCLKPDHGNGLDGMIRRICWGEKPVVSMIYPVSELPGNDLCVTVETLVYKALVMLGAQAWTDVMMLTQEISDEKCEDAVLTTQSLVPKCGDSKQDPRCQVLGISVVDCSDTDKNIAPVVAVVSSLDSSLTRYSGHARVGGVTNSAIDKISELICYAVLKSNPEMLPEVIVIYRTGVPDGKLHYIFVAEFQNEWVEAVKLIRRQTGNMKYDPKVTVVMVDGDPGTRFFVAEGGSVVNPPPGCVVDTGITKPGWFDFYLTSKEGTNGATCSVPTYYNVVKDTVGWSADHLQTFTYLQTFLNFNSQCGMAVPAAVRYATSLAKTVSSDPSHPPDSEARALQGRLWWL